MEAEIESSEAVGASRGDRTAAQVRADSPARSLSPQTPEASSLQCGGSEESHLLRSTNPF